MFEQDLSRLWTESAGKNGVSKPVFAKVTEKLPAVIDALMQENIPLIHHCLNEVRLDEIEATVSRIKDCFSTLVVCGMGGSSLSGRMLCALKLNPYTQTNARHKVLFLENIDPQTVQHLTEAITLSDTLFLIISKSGGTAETLSHLSVLWNFARQKMSADQAAHHFMFITEAADNALRNFGSHHGIAILEHHPGIGGRYAALTNVGLLPACFAGLDIRALNSGAAEVFRSLQTQKESTPAAQGAASAYAFATQGKNISVLFPYCDLLYPFAWWHRQIWAESLGKEGKGNTPAPALGSVDQHSQLQLYLDGPKDKLFTLIALTQRGKGATISSQGNPSLSYLDGHTLGDLIDAQQKATLDTLAARQCPVRLISVPVLHEGALGALTAHFMLETILTGRLMGINPFDQPAVEEGKKRTIAFLAH